MMEKTLILKHISRMLCLLISYSKFTRTCGQEILWKHKNSDIMGAEHMTMEREVGRLCTSAISRYGIP